MKNLKLFQISPKGDQPNAIKELYSGLVKDFQT